MIRLFIELYLDEDVDVLLAQLMRVRGFVVVTTQEAGQLRNNDVEQLAYAVSQQYIALVIENDGGRIDLLDFDADTGEVTVRFVGSCANCPASILSVETVVKPPLLSIPGVFRVVHRTRLRASDQLAFDLQ